MKLLTPQATEEASNAQVARGLLRLQEMQAMEKEWRMKLANAEADFNDTLARNRKIWEDEEAAHMLRVKEREHELLSMQPKPVEILPPSKPVEPIEAHDDLREMLETKLDEVGEREQTLLQREKSLKIAQEGFDAQKASMVRQSSLLTQEMADFGAKKGLWDAEKAKKEEELLFSRRSLEGERFSLAQAKAVFDIELTKLDKKEAELKAKEIELNKPIVELQAKANALLDEAMVKNASASEREGMISRRELQMDEQAKKTEKELRKRIEKIMKQENDAATNADALEKSQELLKIEQERLSKERAAFVLETTLHNVKVETWLDEKEKKEAALKLHEEKCAVMYEHGSAMLKQAEEKEQNIVSLEKKNEVEKEALAKERIRQEKVKLRLDQLGNDIDARSEELAEKVDAFTKEQEEFVAEKTKREKELDARQMKIGAREKAFEVKESKVNRQEKFLSDWAARLKDKEGSLERAQRTLG